MNDYIFTIWLLFAAALGQSLAAALALQSWRQREQSAPRRRMWLAFGLAAALLALHHGHTLSLAAQTGLYDFSQAALAMLSSLLAAYAIVQLRRA